MNVLLFEPAKGGHHLVFLRYVIEDLLAGGHAVHLAAESAPEPSPPLREALGTLLSRVRWVQLDNGVGRLLHGRRLDALARAQSRVRADTVFISCFDLVSSGLFRRTGLGVPPPRALQGRVTGIFVRPRVADERSRGVGRLKQTGFFRLYRRGWFNRLLVLDETLVTHLRNGLAPERFVPLADPWDGDFSAEQTAARRALGLPLDTFLYLHYGTASRRKGLPTVIKAAALLPDAAPFALVAAGRIASPEGSESAALRELAARGKAYVYDRYITNEEEWLFFRACDAVVLAYEGHYGSSNVQARAAAAQRPVVASAEGLVGHRTRVHGLGLTFETANAAALAEALATLKASAPDVYAAGLRDYAALHSRKSFRDTLLRAL